MAGSDRPALAYTVDGLVGEHLGRTCTAVVLRVERGSDVVMDRAWGTPDPDGPGETRSSTPFDLASITKMFVSSAVLNVIARGALALDTPVHSVLPGFTGAGKESVTVRHLLTHTSGLPPLVRLYGSEAAPGDPRTLVLSCPLDRLPGREVVYSDVGFMTLGFLLSDLTRQSLRDAVTNLVLRPLALGDTSYGPRPDAAATELDPWRGRRIRGEVHDENAAVLGGASGHAGLFGTAADVSRLGRAYLAPVEGFLPPALMADAVREQAVTEYDRRGLGWKLRSASPEAAEGSFSAPTFGHYGFTGTAIWTDPLRDATVVLLANRVYFGRDAEGIHRLRRAIFTAVAQHLPPAAGD